MTQDVCNSVGFFKILKSWDRTDKTKKKIDQRDAECEWNKTINWLEPNDPTKNKKKTDGPKTTRKIDEAK